MKFACVSDTHTKHGEILDFPEADVLLHAGDFTNKGLFDERKIVEFNLWLGSLPYDKKIVICGNHELQMDHVPKEEIRGLLFNAIYLDQETYEIEGIKIYGEPRQPEFHDWAFNINRSQMFHIWDKVPKDTDILVTHGPPYGYGDRGGRWMEKLGCKAQADFLEYGDHDIKHVICGHIHESRGLYRTQRAEIDIWNVCAVDLYHNLQPSPIAVFELSKEER